jgi:uncharacterized membrane protein YfcA
MAPLNAFDLGGLAAGLAAGLLSGMFGIGGGIVLVPLLGLLLGLPQKEAQGVTLAVLLLPIGLPAVLAYAKRVTIRWWLVAALVVGFLGGVSLGARIAVGLDERPLRILFSCFVAVAAALLWRRAARRSGPPADAGAPQRSDWNGLWIGAAGGVLAGLFGIGGGIVMVPLLVWAQGVDQHEAQAVSLAVMLPPVGLPGVLVYAQARGGVLPWILMAFVAAGFAFGALGGARLAVRMRTTRLTRAFALFLFCVAIGLAGAVLLR